MKQRLMAYAAIAMVWGGVWFNITQNLWFAVGVTLALIVPTEIWTLIEER